MKDRTIQEVMERVIKANVRGTQADHRVAFIEELEGSVDLRALEHAYVFKNLYGIARDKIEEVSPGNVVTKFTPPSTPIKPMASKMMPAASLLPLVKPPVPTYVPRKGKDVSALIAEIKNAVLMDALLPGFNVKIRDATFGQMRDCGGWMQEVGLQRPRHYIVGNYLTEKDLHNVFIRVAA